ncbi:hypothetical protein Ancab_025755 [Ancistrocladus abbreviatus]
MHPIEETVDHHHHSAPSFNIYSNDNLAQIAARVAKELSTLPEIHTSGLQQNLFAGSYGVNVENNIDGNDDFEFDLVNKFSTQSGIGPVYPVFDLELLKEFEYEPLDGEVEEPRLTVQLKKLFIRDDLDQEPPSSSSSSEVGELDGVPPETYCLWTPAKATAVSPSPSPNRCMKSKSTGSTSKPWKFRDLLLNRSRSDGSGGLLLKPRKKLAEVSREKTYQSTNKTKPKIAPTTAAKAREAVRDIFHDGNKGRDGKKTKSYLPYRRYLVGLFAAPQELRIVNFRPF